MSDDEAFERALDDWLTGGSDHLPTSSVEAVLVAVRTTPQERDLQLPLRTPRMSAMSRIAAVIAIVAIVGVGAAYVMRPNTGPSSAGTPAPSPITSAPLVWTPRDAELDWPGPLRIEAGLGASQRFGVAEYADGIGDSGSGDPWTDITHVMLRTGTTTVDFFELHRPEARARPIERARPGDGVDRLWRCCRPER